jgi:hypothetical protein
MDWKERVLICSECKQAIDPDGKRRGDSNFSGVIYYSCREAGCAYDVCPKCAYRGIRHEHRQFREECNTLSFMMTTLNGRASHLVEDEDDDTWAPTADAKPQTCNTCSKPVDNGSRCKICKAPYCNHECLKKDWNRHRTVCRRADTK